MTNELHRQGIHFTAGIVLAGLAATLTKGIFLTVVGIATLLGVLFLIYFPGWYKRFFGDVEREHTAFRGKGAVFFAIGVLLAALLFWEHAPLAILILAIPDVAATLFGAAFQSPSLPYNRRKSVMGSAVFFVSTSLLLSVRYQELTIFFIAFLLTALESFDYRDIPFLDDNMVVPVVAAYLLTFL